MGNFLIALGKPILPGSMPTRFIFPPRVAHIHGLVSPMPNLDFSAFGNHFVATVNAVAS